MTRVRRGVMHGIVHPLTVVLRVDRFIGSDVRVAEKIAGGDRDVTKCGDIINGSEAIFRPLGVICRFAAVSNGVNRWEGHLLRCHFRFPFSVFTHAE